MFGAFWSSGAHRSTSARLNGLAAVLPFDRPRRGPAKCCHGWEGTVLLVTSRLVRLVTSDVTKNSRTL